MLVIKLAFWRSLSNGPEIAKPGGSEPTLNRAVIQGVIIECCIFIFMTSPGGHSRD